MSDAQAPAALSTAERSSRPSSPRSGSDEPSRSADLYLDATELTARLVTAVEESRRATSHPAVPGLSGARLLDAFLLSAGICQVVEDRLQGASWGARRLVDHLTPGARGPAARSALRAARLGIGLSAGAFGSVGPGRGLRRWGGGMATLRDRLAGAVVDGLLGGGPGTAPGRDVVRAVHEAAARLAALPAAGALLGGEYLRPPSCFRSFDQHPADAVELARRFSRSYGAGDRPLLVLGVRTSGSYLAPLAGATLRRLGHRSVAVGTTRPGLALLPGRAAAVRAVREGGGAVLVLDDPPASGGSLAAVAAAAERAGFPADAVVPLFATFEDDGPVPDVLRRYPCVVLPGGDWEVRRRLAAASLTSLLPELLPGAGGPAAHAPEIGAAGPLSRWSHLSVPLTAHVRDADGRERALPLLAQWAGVGYLGRQAVTVARALDGLVPEVHGFADGVLLRTRLYGEPAPGPGAAPDTARPRPAEVARYVAARQRLLAVPADRSLELIGRQPVWEVAARVLAPVGGRLDPVLRPALLYPLTRSLLAAPRPCVVDGRTVDGPTGDGRWIPDGAGGRVKTGFADGAFSNLDLATYDAAFDLAGAATEPPGGPPNPSAHEAELLAAYHQLTGHRIDPARWCLLRLVQNWDAARLAGTADPARAHLVRAHERRAQAAAVRRFLADAYLADLDTGSRGPWCVLDIDGVLESDVLGFPASSPQGMLALRALRAHGYRVLLATGRSLPEVRDRCAAYRLAGGVGEYGAAAFDALTGTTLPLSGTETTGLRRRLAALPGVFVDPYARWSLRASAGDGPHRTALPARTAAALLREPPYGPRFTVVPGDAQSDFVPRGVDKARGVRALLAALGDATAVPALAVGDTAADLPLLTWARRAAAPANAAPAVAAAGVPVARHPYQAGLAEIIGRLIGHRPGGCPACRAPAHAPEVRALLALLAVPEAGRAGSASRLAALARATGRATARARAATDGEHPG
ncbi:HAD hydrolase family protein [Streptomyces sp. SP17BM10]|uniref:HAD hydrolase family protein n=1 Tax=Streptomyces sp. SP17BM10 TaxID=3002530 RepID=UPI002E7AABE9|nr:HAD hydrolase family protein [Streptomyces sp. SP17BM10]MEE1787358.1 HAD hydrolase family protein [Streptomyces sp. SP17BM10]